MSALRRVHPREREGSRQPGDSAHDRPGAGWVRKAVTRPGSLSTQRGKPGALTGWKGRCPPGLSAGLLPGVGRLKRRDLRRVTSRAL